VPTPTITCITSSGVTAERFNYTRRMIMRLALCGAITCALVNVVCARIEATTVAVFDFELIDTSLEGEARGLRADEQARLLRLSDHLRRRLTESGRFALLDITTVASEARANSLQGCGGCDARLAKRCVVGGNPCCNERGHARQYRRVLVTRPRVAASQSITRVWIWSTAVREAEGSRFPKWLCSRHLLIDPRRS
jgi:hypothetical protein